MTEDNELHFPAIEEFAALPEDVRLFAIMGALISLGSAFEPVYFRLYQAARRLDAKEAGNEFYDPDLTAGRRQQLTGKVVRGTLGPSGLAVWDILWSRLRVSTGKQGHRNFFGHTPVRQRSAVFDPNFFDPEIFDTEGFAAQQDEVQAAVRGHEPRLEGFEAALDNYKMLKGIYEELVAFTDRYMVGDYRG